MTTIGSGTVSRRKFLASAAGAAAVVVANPSSAWSAVVGRSRAMRIGIIGSGAMGGGLGSAWSRAGHEILFSSRNPSELSELVASAGPLARSGLPEEAAAFGEVVLIAVPYGALPQVGRDHAALMRGKIVIDCGNPREDRDGPMANDAIERGTGVTSAEYLPGVRLVRAFNAIAATMIGSDAQPRIGIPIAGDDAAAVETVTTLVVDAGFDPVFVGPLNRAREFDRGTAVYVRGMTAAQLREALSLP